MVARCYDRRVERLHAAVPDLHIDGLKVKARNFHWIGMDGRTAISALSGGNYGAFLSRGARRVLRGSRRRAVGTEPRNLLSI